jgi:hypothetical protein
LRRMELRGGDGKNCGADKKRGRTVEAVQHRTGEEWNSQSTI